jgi:hypothetical protein
MRMKEGDGIDRMRTDREQEEKKLEDEGGNIYTNWTFDQGPLPEE